MAKVMRGGWRGGRGGGVVAQAASQCTTSMWADVMDAGHKDMTLCENKAEGNPNDGHNREAVVPSVQQQAAFSSLARQSRWQTASVDTTLTLLKKAVHQERQNPVHSGALNCCTLFVMQQPPPRAPRGGGRMYTPAHPTPRTRRGCQPKFSEQRMNANRQGMPTLR